jgi:hypothetical protein
MTRDICEHAEGTDLGNTLLMHSSVQRGPCYSAGVFSLEKQ